MSTTAVEFRGAVVQRDVMVPMRDGVRLATDIYWPSEDGQRAADGMFPLLVSRTPYGKQRPGMGRRAGSQEQAERAAHAGFAVAIQDTRGRYNSEGAFRSMQDDGPDGWDTLEWLAKQPWCNGRIGMYGVSYLGAVQMMLAPLRPLPLVAAFSEQPSSDEFTDRTFHSGALTLANVEGWAVNSSGEQYNQRLASPLREQAIAELEQYRQMGAGALEVLPLEDVPWLRLNPGLWKDVLAHLEDPSFFAANDIRSQIHRVNVPIYHLGGWFDPFLRNTIDHYKGAMAVQPDQRLILGPWTHGGMAESAFEDGSFDDFGYALAWHDRWLRGRPGHPAQAHPVIVYVMGANRWRAEQGWPLPGTVVRDYYLRTGGGLSPLAPGGAEDAADTYAYDPSRPVPSPSPMVACADVRSVLERDDVLVYATTPLEESVEVTGEISATLYAASSAEDTDFMLRVVDMAPTGEAYSVVDGIVRARYRRSRTLGVALAPNVVERYEINLWATSLVFERGHRIGVIISSSNFPKYDRHPNVFRDLRKTTERDFVVATQRVIHTAEMPSAVHLPVIPRERPREWIDNPMPLDA